MSANGKRVIGHYKGRPVYRIAGGAPTPLELMERRLEEVRDEATDLYGQRGALIDKAAAEKRGFTDEEQSTYDQLTKNLTAKRSEIKPIEERVAELREEEKRENAAAETRVDTGATGEQRARVTDPEIYVRGGKNGHSYFRDLAKAKVFGDEEAADRLRRNNKAVVEARALGNTGAVGGSGGEFAPPGWLVDQYIALIRAGRVTANLFNRQDIPDGVSSVNLPAIATGTTVARQTTQNTALSQTDLTTTYVQTGFTTLGGKQVVSQQLLDQSAINFDDVITGDLAAAYAAQVGGQVYSGAGTGTGTGAVVNGLQAATIANTVTWTQASPTPAGFYGQAAKMLAAFQTARFMPPTVWVMHPRRWYWLCSVTDTAGRPLVVPQGQAFNTLATMSETPSQGFAGYFLGLPVYIDPQVPTNVGAGTNQDLVYLLKQDDLWLFESDPRPEVFRETYADSVGVLFRLYGYVGTILNRYAGSIGVMTGTGLITPTFAS